MTLLSTPFTPKECLRLQRKFTLDELNAIDNVIYGSKWLKKYNFWINHKPLGTKMVSFKVITPGDVLAKLLTKKVILDFSETYVLKFGNKAIKSETSIHDCLYKAAILLLSDCN